MLSAMEAAAIALVFASGFGRLERDWVFNIGVDILGIAICCVIYYGCMSGRDRQEETTYLFTGLLMSNAAALFLDECAWLVQGVAPLRVWNLSINVLFYVNGIVLVYQFWRYIRTALQLDSILMRRTQAAIRFLLIPAVAACCVNLFYPLYFSVDTAGVYRRETLYPLCYAYVLFSVGVMVVGLLCSNAPGHQKAVVVSFVTVPLLNALLTWNTFGVSTQYAATLVSITLIYSVLFAERSKSLAATRTELQTATQIQAAMLPDQFPPFPDRREFDLYASMDPAREVGGDFYDFFLVDDDHLCLLIADVSGKGVPAALFMMASKIILASSAKMGKSPAQILADTNAAICSNNREEMFVTVWLGILEISTGKLTAANAGHEYPVLKKPGGAWELLKDKHGLVVGAMDGAGYRQYELLLEPGTRLFVYTDGVPEATDAENRMFGTGRMLEALNSAPDAAPEFVLKNMRKAVDDFVQGAEQFDDLTMLCLEYRGAI